MWDSYEEDISIPKQNNKKGERSKGAKNVQNPTNQTTSSLED
jgi:hypothetical protein